MIAQNIAVIGAGMAGLSCATELARRGVAVTLFDKGRGPGGRMASRRAEVAGETIRFDHGAQYFTARDPDFIAATRDWMDAGAVKHWAAAGQEKFVGTPGMNGPLKHMAAALDVHWGTRITSIIETDSGWTVQGGEIARDFGAVLIAMPAEQAAELLADAAPSYSAIAATSKSDPCWAVMAAFDAPLPIKADTLRNPEAAISWAARDGAKPDRSGGESWVLHASPEQSREILELDPADAADTLLSLFFAQTGSAPIKPVHLAAHRWRYAMAKPRKGEPALWDADKRLGMAGDWLVEPRVEGAWLSGNALAKMVVEAL